MAFTRTQIRTMVQQRMDSVNSKRWDTTAGSAGEIDQILGMVGDREWRRILEADEFYRVQLVQPATPSDSSGRYLISDLTTGTGNNILRFNRIIGVVVDAYPLRESKLKDHIANMDAVPMYNMWFRDGTYLYVLPVQAGKTLVSPDGVWVNHIPVRIDLLSADGDSVVFPEGYEDILALETAARLLSKGGTEVEAAAWFMGLAKELRQDMLGDIARASTNPMRMAYDDTREEWAG